MQEEDDCETHYVSDDDLKNLLKIVKTILSLKGEEQIKKAEELLPSKDGFFFGGKDYDKYYFEQLNDTKKILTQALKLKGVDIYYNSSW